MFFTCASYATGSSSDETIIKLKSFYETYCTLMNNRAIAYPDRLHKADSLIQKNCTPEFTDAFRLEQREGVGFDTLEIIDLTDTYFKIQIS